jgi:23S rRNA pseudouridine1911/1915/1917 synthase
VLYLGINDIHILNRLDKETSGLVVVAKDRYARSLLEPCHEHIVRKYLCLVEGQIKESGRIENYIQKSEDSNKRIVSNEGQIAISNYNVIKVYDDKTLLEFILETGRTHQIRVHTSNMGHPIIGDRMYGNGSGEQLCLTSYYVEFKDPFTNEIVNIEIGKRW